MMSRVGEWGSSPVACKALAPALAAGAVYLGAGIEPRAYGLKSPGLSQVKPMLHH